MTANVGGILLSPAGYALTLKLLRLPDGFVLTDKDVWNAAALELDMDPPFPTRMTEIEPHTLKETP